MPSKSKAQADLMRAVAHNAAFAKKVDIPQSVGREFVEADKRAKRRETIRKVIRKVRTASP
jgi:tRNA A37 methylthiotransferase MiaB